MHPCFSFIPTNKNTPHKITSRHDKHTVLHHYYDHLCYDILTHPLHTDTKKATPAIYYCNICNTIIPLSFYTSKIKFIYTAESKSILNTVRQISKRFLNS